MLTFHFEAQVWRYVGSSSWHFVSLPESLSEEIKVLYTAQKRGWGSLPVEVRVGSTTWNTSIFPDGKRNCYLLPLKASVREKETLKEGMDISVEMHIREGAF